jgi:hypothetical protein
MQHGIYFLIRYGSRSILALMASSEALLGTKDS